jgi:uncharacterized protein YbcI
VDSISFGMPGRLLLRLSFDKTPNEMNKDASKHRGKPWNPFSALEVSMKTLGEMEGTICEGISRFEQEYMGRGPKDIRAHLLGDLLVVRLQGVLTVAEQQLVKSQPPEKGRDLLKEVRTHLIETARPIVEAMIQEITGVKVISLHHDISTKTGEEVVLFTLAELPLFRETKKK